MRDGANRAFGYAILASILLHALLLLALPSLRELAAQLPAAPRPLVARLVQATPPPAPVADVRKAPAPEPRPALPRRSRARSPSPPPSRLRPRLRRNRRGR